MATRALKDLELEIERLVREHLDAQRHAAAAAVERAFASAARTERPAKVQSSAPGCRRTQEEIAELMERLYAAVRAKPGETMTILAAQLGQTPSALNRPMVLLKRSGRIRSAGQRNLTRYFPMGSSRST